jgi:SAM-dependent methyltransferase/uncharacterized protein YbaR (Trm112 family)
MNHMLSAAEPPIPQQLLKILRCPLSGLPLQPTNSRQLDWLNDQIRQGRMVHGDGSTATAPLTAGLQTPDGSTFYRVDEGILVLLPALALRTGEAQAGGSQPGLRSEKQAVQSFYDELGWTRNRDGDFVDSEKWEDLRPVARDYVRQCHQRVQRHLKPQGRYLLDVASGPVQYAEYEQYSAGYEARICVDISPAALKHAQARLGRRGIYIVGDITNLPFQDGSMDGVVSLHTIYHLPADEQATAFRELHRVLAPGGTAAVVYVWRSASVKLAELPASLARGGRKLARNLLSLVGPRRDRRQSAATPTGVRRRLFFHSHPYRWFVGQDWSFRFEIQVWRSLSLRMQRSYFHGWLAGRAALRWLFRLEEQFPRAFGRWGAYPLILVHRAAAENHHAPQLTRRTRQPVGETRNQHALR